MIEIVVVTSILLSSFFVILALYYSRLKLKRIGKIRSEIDSLKEDILNAEKEFKLELNKNQYFSKKVLFLWKKKWTHIESSVRHFCEIHPNWRLKAVKNAVLRDSISCVNQIFVNGFHLTKKRNEKFIESECVAFKSLFDTLEKYPLTQSQQRSIITDEYNNLVVAGAGTGKTSTIVGKVGYILRKGLAKPEDILLLAFAREAMNEMAKRVSSPPLGAQIDVKTFHALGLNIIAKSEGIKPSVSELSEDPHKLSQFIRGIIGFDQQHNLDEFIDYDVALEMENNFFEMLTDYFLYHLRPYRSVFEFSSLGEYIDYIKENQIRSLNGEKVKSYEECEIANFLYINGINYLYEKDYEFQTASREHRQYQPDFYLPDYGIYIEHFGINKNGETAPFVDKDEYLQGIEWKQNLHKKYGTKLIETFSHEKAEGVLLTNLEIALRNNGVEFQKIAKEEILEKINRMGVIIPFVKLLAEFLNLFKSSNLTLDDLREKAKEFPDWKRYNAFLDIFEPIYESYELHLKKTNKIDFHDMIKLATKYVKEQRFESKYKYILVDEFQDISQSRNQLLKAMIEKNSSCKLLCVGDDWQSIYRFTGSDLSIMTNFSKDNLFSEQMCLYQTFRLNNMICEVSSEFIMKNKDQISKKLVAKTNVDSPAITLVWSKTNEERKSLVECLSKINDSENHRTSVFVIGRYRHLKPRRFNIIQKKFPNLNIKYYTAHGSKGRQADYVIVVGLESGTLGFPCKIQGDPVLNLVLTEQDSYPDAEERRLFYVALTRAKKHVYLLADPNYPSPFINEMLKENGELVLEEEARIGVFYCPRCLTGLIIKRENLGTFYSCNNYPYCDYKAKICPDCANGFLYPTENNRYYCCSNKNCSFKTKICPICEDGYLIERKKYTKFLGCSNYPNCRYTETFE